MDLMAKPPRKVSGVSKRSIAANRRAIAKSPSVPIDTQRAIEIGQNVESFVSDQVERNEKTELELLRAELAAERAELEQIKKELAALRPVEPPKDESKSSKKDNKDFDILDNTRGRNTNTGIIATDPRDKNSPEHKALNKQARKFSEPRKPGEPRGTRTKDKKKFFKMARDLYNLGPGNFDWKAYRDWYPTQ